MSALTKITVRRRADDWHASLNGDERRWGCGKTPSEAIGEAIRSHAEDLGIIVEWPEPAEGRERVIEAAVAARRGE